MKRILIFMTLCCVWIGIFAVGSYSRKGNRLIFTLAKEKVRMDFCADGMFRVYHSVDGNFAPDEQWMVRNYDFSPVDYTVSKRNWCMDNYHWGLTDSSNEVTFLPDCIR